MDQYLAPDDMDWQSSADRLWGIPLYPTGEMYIGDFIMEVPDDTRIIRTRLLSVSMQFLLNYIMMSVFAQNFRASFRMVRMQPHFLSGWFCLVSAFFGISWGAAVAAFALDIFNCRVIIWYFVLLILLSTFCNSAIVLQKAYLVLLKKRWVLFLGITLMLPQFAFLPLCLMYSYVTLDEEGGCGAQFSYIMPLCWFGVTIPINLLYSAIFSHVAYKQYKTYGSDAWRRLMREGIQTMCLVVLCNMFCATFIVLQVAGKYSEMFFIVDWLITSTILARHCNVRRKGKATTTQSNSYTVVHSVHLHLDTIRSTRHDM